MSARVSAKLQWTPLCGLLFSLLAVLAMSMAFAPSWHPDLNLNGVWQDFYCGDWQRPLCDAPECAKAAALETQAKLRLHANKTAWSALVFEGMAATLGITYALFAIVASGREQHSRRAGSWALLVFVGLAALLADLILIRRLLQTDQAHGYLSDLLSSLPATCRSIRWNVTAGRLLGEPAGCIMGTAMFATVYFREAPDAATVSERFDRLQRLLYLVSLLFVAALMISQANFNLVLARWNVGADEKTGKLLTEVVTAGITAAGVGYSTMTVAFYVPARALLSSVARATPGLSESKVLERSWQNDLRDILANLAPLLSAPALNALLSRG